MMKRLGFLLTMMLAVVVLVAGCGKLNDQPTAARPAAEAKTADAPTNGVAASGAGLSLGGAATATGDELKVGGAGSQRTLVTPDGTMYEGEMKDGKPNGLGTLADPRGTYQKGEWRNGLVYRISGTCVFPDGTKETGTWNNDGTKSGGTIWFTDGRIYKGDWVVVDGQADLPYGMGTMTWTDGRQYAGHFANGKMDGVGKMTYTDGKTEDGSWKQDAFVGPTK